ncbi:Site-specific recombinase XerD [Paraburkholderia tropica]|uniref:DUF6538 domain-containing protein n=1 Tax=Paraburkholderia tropica TaxID=92647 RepID=UPI001CB15672|nr:DUF6538 domain-containing protein [Paraburkholderia tropica]CAG9219980.1 Site-specific recombinase XerD [Paraburkholderia tropica]
MTNHLIKRGNVYYFRRKVPVDLEEHLGQKAIMFSLRTREYAEAKQLAATHTVLTDAQFAAARALKAAKTPEPNATPPMDSAMADVFLVEEEWRREYEANKQWHDARSAGERDQRESVDAIMATSGMPSVSQMEFFASEGGFHPDDMPTPKEVALVVAMRRAAGTANSSKIGHAGIERDVAPAISLSGETLRHVVPSWIARNAPKANAISRTNKALDLFEEAVGLIPLRQLTKAHGAKFVRFLLDESERGFKRKTASNHANAIGVLVRVAVKDDLIDRNPFDLTFDKTIGAETRTPWTDAELALVYMHPLFSDRMDAVPRWQRVTPADGRALLLILQHTGARIGEVAQLRRCDFLVQDGMTAIRITAEAGTLKTKESERTVPLAAHLLADAWFGAWVAGLMDGTSPGAPAFPSMAGRTRGPGDTAVQWFFQFRKAAGLPEGTLNGAHRFRHWIRSALAAKHIGEETADAITGHAAQGSSGRVAYTKIPLDVMLDALNRLTFPNLCSGRGS